MAVDFDAMRVKFRNMNAAEAGVQLSGNHRLDTHANSVFHDVCNLLIDEFEELNKPKKKADSAKVFKEAVKGSAAAKKAAKD
jgi:hypothetical protein